MKHLPITLRIFFLLLSVRLQAQQEIPLFEQLYTTDSLSLVIEGDVHTMQKKRNPDVWMPAQMTIYKGKTRVRMVAVEMQARGNARRKICHFPPVKIRLANEALPDSLHNSRNIKIVSACSTDAESETLVLKEYLMYRLYHVLSEESFRVKLVSLDFKQLGRRHVFHSSTAFLIENEYVLAQRLRATPVKMRVISPRGIDSVSLDRVCLFQYMIGNTDWSIYNEHNVCVFTRSETNNAIVVPYDFDYAGAVGAPYAVPAKGLPIQDVRHRYYLGLCRQEAFKQQIMDAFLMKKNALLNQCQEANGMSQSSRRAVTDYLNGFFEILKDPKAVRTEILEHCDNFKKKP